MRLPEIERQQKLGKDVVVRADAASTEPEVYEKAEERGAKYAIRISASDSLERDIAKPLTRQVGRPSHKPVVRYKSFPYQSRELEQSPQSCSEGGVPSRRAVPACRVHRDQPTDG
jgi:hypothetical protein